MFINTKAIPDDIKTLFQRKTFNDTSFLDITLSDFNTTITNMFNVDLTIDLSTDYYEPINDDFVFKVNNESFYINLPILFDENYNPLELGTTHSLKQNNDGSYRYTKYFSLNGYLKNSHNVKFFDSALAAGTSQNKSFIYQFPASGDQSVNNRTSANLTTARNATSANISTEDFTNGAQEKVCGSSLTVASSNGSNTFTTKFYNGCFIVFDSSGITTTVSEAEFKFRGGYIVVNSGWDSTSDISIILLKGNSELGNNVANYNDFVGHRSSWSDAHATEYSAEYVADQTFSAAGLYGAAEAVPLNSDALSDLESEDEVQLLPVEFDEWYSNDFNSSVPVNATAERTLVMTGPSYSNTSLRPFIEYTAAAASGFGHKTIGVAAASISKVKGVATANIGKVIGVD